MDPPRWQEVKKVLNAVVDLPSDQRSSYLDAIGAKDPDLRREVQSLLSAHEQAGDDFLQGPRTDEGIHLSKDAQIGTYRIVSFIAAGGMGEVYRARDLRLRRDVAIKVLPALLSSDPDRLRRFEQEASAAASLNHPNILAVFQMGTHEGAPYLVSELLEGETLRERIKRGPMTARDVVDYGTQIAVGLAAAHEKGIIHRDLKPENLFVTKDGQVKILDFGLAKLLQHNSVPIASTGSDRTAPGAVIGTVAYMSSEQALGKELDQRTDLFSFGAVLYEMAAGIPAFRGDTVAAVFDAVLNKTPVAPVRINPDVPAKLAEIISKALEKDRDLRYQSAAEMRTDLQRLKRDTESGEFAAKNDIQLAASGRSLRRWITMAAVAIVAALSGAVYLYRHHSPRPLTDKDTIVLAEFTNSTGDPVFDGTLRQGLSAQLEQSPFLNLLSDQRVGQTLSLMTQPQDARLTPALAREVCQRTASAANIEGSIASLGNQYVLGLKAVNCKSGDVLAEDQVTASGKEQVLKAMGEAATRMREKLGESLASVQKFDVPPENVTTLYLIALQAYSQGVQAHVVKGDSAGAVPFYQRAISLDPNFAMAYARLGTAFSNVGQSVRASENIRKAYELRQRVSEPEKFYIVSHYQDLVTGDLEAARKTYELWGQTYSRTAGNLTIIYRQLGEYEKSLAENKVELQLDPGDGITYQQSVSAFIFLNRLDEAKAMAQEAQARHVDSQQMHHFLYMIAFLQKDAAGMERETKQLSGPSFEELALHDRSDTAAYAGEFATARELTRRAVSSAQRADAKEEAAAYQAESAVREALVGNSVQAKQQVKAALALSSGRDVRGMAAVALGFAGDVAQANRLAGDLAKGFPEDTLVQFTYLPVIRALVELHRGDGTGNAKQAIEALAASTPYELGTDGARINFALYPVYVRGAAYLAGHQGLAAVAEFEKIRNHPGIVRNEVISSLAHLQLGRAYALSGETAKAKNAYQNFFALWKAADPEIPILKQANAEYAKLQ